jgi:hypothetical protein
VTVIMPMRRPRKGLMPPRVESATGSQFVSVLSVGVMAHVQLPSLVRPAGWGERHQGRVVGAEQGGSSDVEVELRAATSRMCNSTSPATPHKDLRRRRPTSTTNWPVVARAVLAAPTPSG